MTRHVLIRNARLVNEGQIVDGDLLIADGRIDRIAGSITLAAEIEIDAAGAWLLPGMIDDQVHFREPGLTHKGCIASESAAAVAGGITSFMDMPNTRPPTLDMAAVDAKRSLAAAGSHANYAFHLGVSTHNLDAVAAADPTRIAGIKAFDVDLQVEGSVMASDAFFPFRDGIDAAAEAGIKAVIQPGGSMRDAEVIAAADEHGLAMVFTGVRHFRH